MSTSNSSGGIGLAGLLGIIFIVLKLCEVITWSWWWVLCPFWLGAAIGLIVALVILVFGLGAIGIAGLLSILSKK